MEDSAIVALYWARDEQAIAVTQEKYERYLMKIAFNVLADEGDSEESVNDTYLKAWNSMPDNRPSVLSTYLGKITREAAIDIYRKRTSAKRGGSQYAVSLTELEDVLSMGDTVVQKAEEQQLAKAISEFLRGLPERKRNVFISRYYFLDAVKDIADCAGMSESAVKSMLMRERQDLKKYLEKEGFAV